MRSSKCLRCGLVTSTVAPTGLCATCRGVADETHPIDSAAPTVTREPDGSTVSPGKAAAAVLPAGGYRDVEQLGEGGMGVVWRAEQVATGQTVAVKKLQPDCFTQAGLRRFVAEARALAAVKHANVVRLFDFLPDPADPRLILEYVPGPSLAAHLKEVGPLHPDRAARLTAAAARGVQAAHEAGVVHRDLKPGNLLLTADGRVKVADFGLVKMVAAAPAVVAAGGPPPDEAEAAAEGLTRAGQLAGGTPGFLAPEQIDERFGEVGPAADVWGLGACLYAFLTGHTPFPGGKLKMGTVVTDPLVPPQEVNPAVPADLAAIVVKCLEKDQSKRYPSAAAVADDLDRYLTRDETAARPRPVPVRVWQRLRRTPRAVAVAVGVAVLAVLLGGSLAMVPMWLKETPESIQNGYRRDLRAGKTVTLVGETGFPRHSRWRWGSTTLVESWQEDGTCAFEAPGPVLLELLDDPGVDHYVVRAEVRHLAVPRPPVGAPPREDGNVGIYMGFAHTPDGRGGGVMTLFRLTYSDYDPHFLKTNVLKDQIAQSTAAVSFTGPNRGRSSTLTAHAMVPFRPTEKRPGPWRTVEYVVDGNQLTPRWGPGDRPVAPMAPRALDAAAEYAVTQKKVDAVLPNAGVRVPAWTPRAPLGVYCDSAAVSVRNFQVIPLPAR